MVVEEVRLNGKREIRGLNFFEGWRYLAFQRKRNRKREYGESERLCRGFEEAD